MTIVPLSNFVTLYGFQIPLEETGGDANCFGEDVFRFGEETEAVVDERGEEEGDVGERRVGRSRYRYEKISHRIFAERVKKEEQEQR